MLLDAKKTQALQRPHPGEDRERQLVTHCDHDRVPVPALVCVAAHAALVAAHDLELPGEPASPVEPELFAPPVPDSVASLPGHAPGNGNSAAGAAVVAPIGRDSDPLNIFAGRLAAALGPGPRGDPTCPNRFCAVPNHGPSDRPNVAAHQTSIHGSTQAAGGSSARGFAE